MTVFDYFRMCIPWISPLSFLSFSLKLWHSEHHRDTNKMDAKKKAQNYTFKEFEEHVASRMSQWGFKLARSETGTCIKCTITAECIRVCPDIRASHQGISFIIDAKRYTSNTILGSNVYDKLSRDMRKTGSSFGFLVAPKGTNSYQNASEDHPSITVLYWDGPYSTNWLDDLKKKLQ
ncbi:hypothetical protein PROFUN_16585 [Planoprotostelium fungivorum]|uniref:Uncharacterized protein n=1 Tax=Planoprotostelium fungivorum TaxID=1890364 RepID=A0A2P6MNS2_9EUKA|nr:hypothetical protein PROFUN_16585 [Planoprotostelium fungivorum]